MIINKLILKNFRIFNGAHEFDFSNSKVVVIEGPNGHGKSTIFDAINWVLSGKIDRYTGSSEYQQFNYLINNTAYQGQNPYASVEILLRQDEELITIKRLIRNSSVKLYINSVEYRLNEGQKIITKLLVKENRGELIEGLGVRNSKVDMSAFLASTTILSQEGLENFVRSDKPIERYAILESVLGLKRYGVDFREFLKEIEKSNEKKKGELKASKAGLAHGKEVSEAKYDQKVKHDNRLGKLNKEDLIQKVNIFLSNLEMNNKEPISITEVSEKELLLLKKTKEKSLASIDQLNEINESIKRNYLIDVNSESVELNIKKSKQKSNDIKIKRTKRIQSLEKIEMKEKELINTFRNIQKIKSIEEQIQKKVLKIEEFAAFKENILVELLKKYNQEELNDIAIFDEKYDEWKYSLEQNKRMLELSENRERLKVIESKRKENEQSLEGLIIQGNIKTDKINELNLILNEIKDKQTSKKESYVNRLVNEIQEKILSSENIQSCMVCGTYFNTENELKETVRNQLKILSEDLDELDKQVRKKELMKGSAISEKEQILKDIKKLETELNLLKNDVNEINGKVVELLVRIDFEIKEVSADSLRGKINELGNLVSKYQYKYNLAKEFQRIHTDIEKVVRDKNIFIEEKNNILSKNNIIIRYIDNPHIINIKLARIDNYIYKAKINIKELEEQDKDEEIKVSEEKRKLEFLVEYSDKVKNILDVNSVILDGTELYNLVNKYLEGMTINNSQLDNLNSEIASYLNANELFVLEKEIQEYNHELNIINALIDRHRVINLQLIKFAENHRKVQSDLINGYLDELTGEINNFYRQISPHAYFDFLNLLVKENELFILLSETEFDKSTLDKINLKDTVSASLTLSAAQSTVLAMSIFLALNISQNWSKLSILGIDDPFQNLDDINIYSFIDVINLLVKEEKKQVFISTHHNDFTKLIASKLGLKDSQFSHVSFQSYTREEVSVKSSCYKYLGE